MKIEYGDGGYILEDVPHLTDYLPHLPVYFESNEVHACIVTCSTERFPSKVTESI
ncbi:hypothetical protein Cni_G13492 [Canna indica]|uniref:Uncharacterized protein n=1 Tax=Canna indica TaxID=4628 RepID=A0AAQ3QDS8_9LILI|nr:hypothetical protein Cni_G13492 [Canna indica]